MLCTLATCVGLGLSFVPKIGTASEQRAQQLFSNRTVTYDENFGYLFYSVTDSGI